MFEKIALIIIGIILCSGGVTLFTLGVKYELKKDLPPGYTLLCNEKGKYKWHGRGYTKSYATTKQAAIYSAWQNYEEGEFVDCSDHL